MEGCIFCKLASKEIPREEIYEDEDFFVVPDKFPKADIHFLIIPKKHIHSVAQAEAKDSDILGRLLLVSKKVSELKGITDYRLMLNNGAYVEVPHLHLHFVSGAMHSVI